MRILLLQALRDRRAAFIGWMLGWLTLVGLYVATWPTIKSHGKQYDDILQGLPTAFRSVVGGATGGAFSTPAGYFTAELLAVTGPILAVTMGVLLGSGAVAKDEEEGTLELVLAQPVTRTTVLAARATEGLIELTAVLGMAGLALYSLGQLVDLQLGLAACLRATGLLALLGVEGMALGLFVASLTGRTSRSRAVAGAAGLLAFLLNALGPSIGWMAKAVVLSPFHTLMTADPFRQVPPPTSVLILLAPSAALVGASVFVFRRRDLRLH